MKNSFLIAMAAVLAIASSAPADVFIQDGTFYTVRVGPTPFVFNPGTNDARTNPAAHTLSSNVDTGVTSAQQIGIVPASGQTPVFATETITDLGGGSFEYILSVTSEADLVPAINSEGTASTNSILVIGSNAQNSLDADFPGAGVMTFNAQTLEHSLTSATLEIFDLNDGSLRGSRSVLGFGAFADPDDPNNREWQGNLGATIRAQDTVSADVSNVGDIGEFRFTLVGQVTAVPEPSSLALLGFAGIGLMFRRRR